MLYDTVLPDRKTRGASMHENMDEICATAAFLAVAMLGVEITERRFPVQKSEVVGALEDLTAMLDAAGGM